MELRILKYYIAIVESTSISGASVKLHVSQPSLSHQIQLLEGRLGVKLFERGPRHVILTEEGKLMYHRAKAIVDYIDATKAEIRDINHGMSGCLRIGMSSSCGPMLLPDILSGFRARYPNVRFEIMERNTYELLESLENHLIELAFIRTPFDNAHTYQNIPLSREPLIAVGHESYFSPLDMPDALSSKETPLTAAFFEGKPLIVYRRWRKFLDAFFESHKVRPFIYCENDDARTSLDWANAKFGIAIMPQAISKTIAAENMRHIPIGEPNLITEIHALWDNGRFQSACLKNFINHLKEYELLRA
jgi:DNA-binding transcriptional LysR family regulator